MSRSKSSLVGTTVFAAAAPTANGSAEDICPVCKTIRYLNKDMIFLINPECYHQMCSNCVNRLFAGPNQCPYAGCHKTLRRKDFRQAFFDDLTVEREVDLRRRVASIFNKVEDDFDDLEAYNEYLEKVETLAMDLVSGGPAARQKAEATLLTYEAEHRADIERNRRKWERADEVARSRVQAERDAARAKRLEAARQDAEDRARRQREREADLDTLATAPEGTAQRVMLKRRGQHARDDQLAMEEAVLRAATAAAAGGLSIRGLKDKKKVGAGGGGSAAAESDGPYDPYGGMDLSPSRYELRDTYPNPWLAGALKDDQHLAGGYDIREYYARTMFEAFAGLGVFVEDEKETGPGTSAASVATVGAALAATKMEVDDVF